MAPSRRDQVLGAEGFKWEGQFTVIVKGSDVDEWMDWMEANINCAFAREPSRHPDGHLPRILPNVRDAQRVSRTREIRWGDNRIRSRRAMTLHNSLFFKNAAELRYLDALCVLEHRMIVSEMSDNNYRTYSREGRCCH